MNLTILTVVLAIWLVAISSVMPLSTLIAARPIGIGIVLAVFSLVGLVTFFDDGKEEELDLADDVVTRADESSRAEVATAGARANDHVPFPLPNTPLHDGAGG